MKSDLVDIEVAVHHETTNAWLVSTDGDRRKAVWIPKSMCEIDEAKGGAVTLTLPAQVAVDKGLV